MDIENYLKEYQPLIYRIFSNALSNDHLSHAYLLSGERGIPLKEIAYFLAKSIVCDNKHPLACQKCLSCLRIEDGSYVDLMVFNGEEKTIKKDDVLAITNNFEKTPIESKGIMIYILHLVENMTIEAINSILKFLEEPGRNIYAILTTENESKVLPTIVSRTQVLAIKPINKQIIIKEAIDMGCDQIDAEVLSNFYNDSEMIRKISVEDDYQVARSCLDDFLDSLANSKEDATYYIEKTLSYVLKTKESTRFFLDMLTVVFEDLINISVNNRITLSSYDIVLNELSKKLSRLDASLISVMSLRGQLDLNLNIPLLLDHLIFEITKEMK